MNEADIYSVIGDVGFERLIAAFYRRVRTDDILGPLYPPDDWDAAEARLRSFLIQRFGGPDDYSAARGHPRLRMRHTPFAIDAAAAERWLIRRRSGFVAVLRFDGDAIGQPTWRLERRELTTDGHR
jgi:truncated hemoglobin YjbI